MKSILLFRLGGLGDVLVALPSINLLRSALPGVKVHLVGRRDYGGLLRGSGVVDEAFSSEAAAWTPLFGDGDRIPEALRVRLSGYDLILGLFQGSSRIPLLFSGSQSVSPGCVRSFCYGPDSRISVSRFLFDRTAELLRSRGAAAAPFEVCCRLPLPGDEGEEGRPSRGLLSSSTILHPGSGSPKKCWPLDRFLAVVRALRDRGRGGALVTGEAEENMEPELRTFAFPSRWRWLPRPDLMDLARRLRPGVLYIGNDSGVTHLAAARGAEVVAIFRREFEAAWSPFGRTSVISAGEPAEISVERVIEALDKRLHRRGA